MKRNGNAATLYTPKRWYEGAGKSAQARLLANGMNVEKALRTNDLLRKDEWEQLDEALVRVARARLNGIEDLRAAGLTRTLRGIGVLIDQFEQVSEFDAATQSMDVVTPPTEDTAEFKLVSIPVPITHKGFRIGLRQLDASRTLGQPLDTTNIELATRQVVELLESTLFNGSGVIVGGGTLFGYTNHPDRNTGTLTASWLTAATRDIIADVIAMIAANETDGYFGPYMLYVPQDFFSELKEDYKADSERTFLERILAIPEIQDVKVTVSLVGGTTSGQGNVVLVQMTRDVVDLSIGQDITTVEWEAMGGLLSRFIVMTAMAPRIKSDFEGKSGVAHFVNP